MNVRDVQLKSAAQWQRIWKFSLEQEMVGSGDFQRDITSQIGAQLIKFSSAPAEETEYFIKKTAHSAVKGQHPCGSMSIL
jgi:hypothetical protein